MLKRVTTFAVGMMCGAAVGTAVSLILTPASGKTLRLQSKQHIQTVLLESAQAAESTRQELRQELESKTSLPSETPGI